MDNDTLTTEQALAMLPDDMELHVFSMSMVGAHWSRDAVVDAIRNGTCMLAGETATSQGYGLAVHSDGKWWFVQTKPKEE